MLSPVQLFKLLADETRINIVLLLREADELCVCDICTVLSASQPKISRHIALLRDARLLLDRREGKWIHYRLSPHIPAWAANIIEASWNCQQVEIKTLVNKLADSNCTSDGKALCR
ncbi:metalloregulator ArsR/SmtB family transcription factor [Xenorhabdus sp. XENO-10]|uniref:Metalloregulator ArsR/SmtB family transcription factor n=1 Tax=Xenorhabdus yunnanensis TaxID=3025878 RepID=A0ABT5LHM5_9GAMM|nr:metalloregulator ArsR/SmtB family transcription factor [Xenorhabdus yunnanensis]MDC9590607.1 metalloregulator ArsR/SmtB family transcription factor [Xenorhabdus yunnanensis]